MTLRRIYSDHLLREGGEARLAGDAANHVLRVLRLRQGDSLVLFDGHGVDYDGVITGLTRDSVTVRLAAGRPVAAESPLAITLMQGICRGTRMDTVIQKATELGVARILPVAAARGVVRLDEERAETRRAHWQRVAVAAAEQSSRGRVPEVAGPVALAAALEAPGDADASLLLDPRGSRLGELPGKIASLRLLVGPEGGLSDEERQQALDAGFRAVRLGPRILRTETAPLAALAVLQYLRGDF